MADITGIIPSSSLNITLTFNIVPSGWTPDTLVVEDAEPTMIVMTGSIADTTLVYTDFTITGITAEVLSIERDETNKIITATLDTEVVYGDELNVVLNEVVYPVTNNVETWDIYWPAQAGVLFFAETSNIADGKLYNQVTDATDYLTVTGTAGSYTFECPDTAPYIAADTDQIWHYTDDSIRVASEAELIGYDFTRTIVKYDSTTPNAIRAIMILSSDVDTAKMRTDFELSIWWDNTLSLYGMTKDNRSAEQSVWTPEGPAIVDADGNVYTIITIGTQTWMVENLKTTKFWDDTAIPNITDNTDWANDTAGAYCWHNNDIGYKDRGALYNWYMMQIEKTIIPGYHIPSAAEFDTLNTYLDGISSGTAGGQMKTTGTSEWASPNTGATNSSGFSSRPSSYRTNLGAFGPNVTQYDTLYVKEQADATHGIMYYLSYNNDDLLNSSGALKAFGRPIRLIKD